MGGARAPAPVAQQRGHYLAVVRVRCHTHQHGRADRQRGRHRPPDFAFHLPGQGGLRGDLVDQPGSRQLIELLLERAQPGMAGGMPSRLIRPSRRITAAATATTFTNSN